MKRPVALIHANLGKSRTHDIVGLFQGDPEVKKRYPKEVTPQYLVGTTKLLEIGLTLTQARRTVQLEPEWLMQDEVQARARVNRISQARQTYLYSLICPESEPEIVIYKRQSAQKELLNKALESVALESVDWQTRNVVRRIGDDEDQDS